jgi:hypothetical protein
MKTYDDENIQKYIKSIDNIDNTKLSKWCCGYEGEWRYFGECDKNDKPFGIGRAIAKDKPMMEKVAKKAVKGHEKKMHGMAKGGVTRADGCVSKGHTKGKMITMKSGGAC